MAAKRDDDLIDVKLDKRQISVLLVATLAVGAMVFFLGVVVGRRMSAVGDAVQQHDQEQAKKQGTNKLSDLDRRAEKTTAKEKETKPAAVEGSHGKLQEQKNKEGSSGSKVHEAAEVEKAKKVEAKESLNSEQEKEKEEKKKAGNIRPGESYALQVASVKKMASAKAELKKLASKGYKKVKIVEADLGRRGKWYRVLVGDFQTRQQAEEFKKDFEVKAGIKGTLIKRIK
ncbi:MAG: SPOR domain-containing protein [Deltaproteobacteria bacterium]|nr:SPOR domain-containing protein [Deltaproteobacteria bacterium]